MKKYILVLALFAWWFPGFTQNLVTNGSFENFTPPCPTFAPNGAFEQVYSWRPANATAVHGFPTVDLFCGGPNYSGCMPGPVPNMGSDGSAYVGFHTRVYNPPYNESIYQELSTPLITGASYTISFDLMTCSTGLFTQGPSEFCVYMNADTLIPLCPSTNASVVNVGCIPYDSISTSVWKNHSFQFIAPSDPNIVAFSGAGCDTTQVYYYLDNVVLTADSTTSLQLEDMYGAIKVFPNPFNAEVNIVTENDTPMTFILHDVTSRVIIHKDIVGTSIIRTGEISTGIYYYRVITNGGRFFTGKLVKE